MLKNGFELVELLVKNKANLNLKDENVNNHI
jgi:hypothetical protein